MTQVKLFSLLTPQIDKFENQINVYLANNKDKIKVLDIRYTALIPQINQPEMIGWTAMVIYEPIVKQQK